MSLGSPAQPDRQCGTCTLCCKLMRIDELSKPQGTWCTHCKPGRGCGIYETRPTVCRTFMCAWLMHSDVGPEWRPDKSKMVLISDGRSRRVLVKCDPGSPQAWRKEPFRSQLNRWSSQAGPRGGEVIVTVGHQMTVIANGHELAVGTVTEQDSFSIDYDPTGKPIRCNVVRPNAASA